MELIVLVLIPSLFLMFFPEPLFSMLLSIAAGMRLCCGFFREFRAREEKSVELWSLGGSAMTLVVVYFVQAEQLRSALIYFATMSAMRFAVSLHVHRENSCGVTLEQMKQLNDELKRSFERLSSAPLDELQELENHYGSRINVLRGRVRKTNLEQRQLLKNLEARRDDLQQLIFNALETPNDVDDVLRLFDEAIRRTQTRLEIFSPSMSFKVVRALVPDFRRLLEANVVIAIHYGKGQDFRGRITQSAAKMLRKEFKNCKNFCLYSDNDGTKKFISDDKMHVIADFNVLSFGGKKNVLGEIQ